MSAPSGFDLTGKTAVITGGGGVLGGAIAMAYAAAGARVAVTGRGAARSEAVAKAITDAGGIAKAYAMDVADPEAVRACHDAVLDAFGGLDILVNAAGGNRPGATVTPDKTFFDLPVAEIEAVIDLNFVGGVIVPCQVFGQTMANNGGGSIINISSMAADRPLTRVVSYAASKAAVDNFTKWLAVYFAQTYTPKLRVNAIAPGFFLTEQNRYLLTDEATGGLTARGESIIAHTPMGRFGEPGDLAGAALWLASPLSSFTTGIVVPVDGGFSAFSGV